MTREETLDQLITKIANTMNVSEAHVATAIDTLINTSQPYKPIQGLCKSAKKNDLGVDCISRSRAIERLKLNFPISDGADNSRDRHRYMQALADIQAIRELPSVTSQEPQTFEWCDTCKEYDQENHCCHRWAKVIRNTVEEMKQGYEREVLDKVRAEIETKYGQCKLTEYIVQYDGICTSVNDIGDIADILQIIDKYKAESEGT